MNGCYGVNQIISFLSSVFRNNLKAGRDDGSSVSSFCSRKDEELLWIIGSLLPDPISLLLIPFTEGKDSLTEKTITQ